MVQLGEFNDPRRGPAVLDEPGRDRRESGWPVSAEARARESDS